MIEKGIPYENRARLVSISSEDLRVDMPSVCNYVDGLFIRLGGADGPNENNLYKDNLFVSRANESSKPVIALYALSARYHLYLQRSEAFVKNQNLNDNEQVKLIREQVDSVSGSKVKAIALALYDEEGWPPGRVAGDSWQAVTLVNVLERLVQVYPNLPIIVMTSPEFLQKYPDQLYNVLNNYREKISIAYFEPYFTKVPSATTFAIKDIWQFLPSPDYDFAYKQDNLNITFWVYSYNRFRVSECEGNTISTVYFWDTREEFNKFVKVTSTPQEPPIPPEQPTPSSIEAKLNELLLIVKDIQSRLPQMYIYPQNYEIKIPQGTGTITWEPVTTTVTAIPKEE